MKVNKAPETYPIQFRDKIDEYLWKEHHILGGCCSSIEELKYSVAREVAEKLTNAFMKRAAEYIKEHLFDYWSQSVTDESKFIDEFRKYMGE